MNRVTPQGELRQKQPPLVSQKIRDSARGEDCQINLDGCNHDPETTVLHHLRFFGLAGIAQKPCDFLGIYVCSACHDDLEHHRVGGEKWGFEDILRGLAKTQMRLYNKGLLEFKR